MAAPTISTVISQAKSILSKHIGFPVWQKGFYDPVIRGEKDYKEKYYEVLNTCGNGWNEGNNDPTPFGKYLLSILLSAYRDFESRVDLLDANASCYRIGTQSRGWQDRSMSPVAEEGICLLRRGRRGMQAAYRQGRPSGTTSGAAVSMR